MATVDNQHVPIATERSAMSHHIPMPLEDRILAANLSVFSTKELRRFLESLVDGPAMVRVENELDRREVARSIDGAHL